jgi:tetratricopeptide (TPR) repeat protein
VEALTAAQEAVDLYRGLARARPEGFTPGLAMSLNTLAAMLSGLGRREEAIAIYDELKRVLGRT